MINLSKAALLFVWGGGWGGGLQDVFRLEELEGWGG